MRNFRVTSSRGDLQIYINEKRNFKEMCKNKKDIFQHNMRNRLCQARSNPNLFWQTIKNSTHKQSLHSIHQQQIKQSDWLNYLNQLLFRENMPLIRTSEEVALPEYELVLNSPITHEEIMISINILILGRAQGFDGVGAEFNIKKTTPLMIYVQ